MNNPKLSKSSQKWVDAYESDGGNNTQVTENIFELKNTNPSVIPGDIKKAGIASIKHVGNKLLINTFNPITDELRHRIEAGAPRLKKHAEPNTGELLYEYQEYRTLFSGGRPFLAITFKEIHTGECFDRFFNIILKDKNGKNFITGKNGKFHIKGSHKTPRKDSFIKLWMDTVGLVPYDRPSHICKHMNTKLSGVVVSCDNLKPHHENMKLTTLKHEGYLFNI